MDPEQDVDTHPDRSPRRLTDLAPDDCWALLEGAVVGRVAWCGPDGPHVVPVNLAVSQRQVWFRTAAYSPLLGHCRAGAPVAIEADHLDVAHRSGWSVVVTGTAEAVDGAEVPEAARLLDTWAPGSRSGHVRVLAHLVTGRRLTQPTPRLPTTEENP
ncbi:pyridoxamine 5'-phosphate oxidase family protein [Nocardioides lijunqiniae]|uniref:pyridoxamine 5'-phosphate oxidase family protein n=1 Tax=Nocardioides lijunqiniae TaxID=2760832 RepID=UPI0018776F6E|nr:pyridoxamine 5'-phosphate oxidase family protein [Nocardioides lijunqiniae]